MEFLGNLFSSIGAIHVNAAITIWTFLVNNLTMLLVIGVVTYLFSEEIKQHEHEFVQDKRRLM
ncbi:hypothetical protein JK635_07900 [Neobacillus sp. YIM B02564]|uniref:Uncharacterized protein n=1 Tax=Neobacillus paridis TaxID=2803862 RepID=A0ABS1TLF0_9BACI|nr:hypothetical protein [Neobacillus paridis]MBL4952133.1 hypothetical protein [Neobacillus paridis]